MIRFRQTLFLALLALGMLAGRSVTAAPTGTASYGKPLTGHETVTIARLLADPKAYEGKMVRVEGTIKDVCPKAGCWMDLESSDGTVRFQVRDGVIVFPVDAKGKAAVAEGKVEIQEMTKKQYSRYLEHLAEEKGQPFDESKVGEGPYQIVLVKATGAEIQGQ